MHTFCIMLKKVVADQNATKHSRFNFLGEGVIKVKSIARENVKRSGAVT